MLFLSFVYSSYIKFVIYFDKKKSTIEWIDLTNSKLTFPSLTICPVFKAGFYEQEQLRLVFYLWEYGMPQNYI